MPGLTAALRLASCRITASVRRAKRQGLRQGLCPSALLPPGPGQGLCLTKEGNFFPARPLPSGLPRQGPALPAKPRSRPLLGASAPVPGHWQH